MTGIAQDEAKARRLGVTYGTLKAPLVIASGYSSAAAGSVTRAEAEEPQYCPNCGKPVAGRKRVYCDAVCSSRYRGRKHYAKKKEKGGT